MFQKASQLITSLKEAGKDAEILEFYYNVAKGAWSTGSFRHGSHLKAKNLLDMIPIPEPALLPILSILGLVLLPALQRCTS